MARDATSSRGRPSIYDVAHRAGVSHMTVSRVINDHPNIRESTRRHVREVIAELGYQPSSVARALASRHSRSIGVMVDAADHYGPKNTLLAIERAARSAGYTVATFSLSGWEEGSAREGLADLTGHGVDAVCLIAPRMSSLLAVTAPPLDAPTIVIGDVEGDPSLTTVAVDQGHGASLVAEHLTALGHRSLLHLAGPLDWIDASARERAWRREMDARGLPPHMLIGDWTSDSGFEVGARHPIIDDVTAIFASNDQMALGLLHGLTTRGLRVPEDIAIVGYDDAPESRHLIPPLTTVRQDFDEVGRLALGTVFDVLAGRTVESRQRVLPELIVRASSIPFALPTG
ncbi:LacI family DNA-binding transcriptional regulator [Microbacterium sp. BK668]|uniref:LacI family DNA-binding transcriptional regulator n=1 Tax=Microbacterium sp. BK668 TaxID=2512118 RepID=UPI00105C03E2|nr:LacI family DNA-binding transcriptional regulator [Microbacterium sp. BK668]TDN90731.1 LacI family transcriptional regulator [Microbacterium sp. BK668]